MRLEDVRFAYEPEAGDDRPRRWALQGLDLVVQPGQLAAVVGASGAGKTTISYLVPRLCDATSGTVRLDGHDVRDLTLASLSGAIGMVTQETYLFHATPARQPGVRPPGRHPRRGGRRCQGRPDPRPDPGVRRRLRHRRRGARVPAVGRGEAAAGHRPGPAQGPTVLILDEATSALDTLSERLVQTALEPLMKGRTTIAIAHRLSTIRAADVIFVIDQGRVVEQGDHEDLLARGGRYAALFSQQYGDGLVEARCANGLRLSDRRVLQTTSPAA